MAFFPPFFLQIKENLPLSQSRPKLFFKNMKISLKREGITLKNVRKILNCNSKNRQMLLSGSQEAISIKFLRY